MSFLFFSLIGSACLLGITFWIAREPRRRFDQAAICSLVGILPAFACFLSPSLVLSAVLLSVIGFVCMYWKPKTWTHRSWCLGAMLVSYAVVGVPAVIRLKHLRDRYPMESLADRLAYETLPGQTKAAPSKHADVEASFENEATRHFQYSGLRSWRSIGLAQIHEHFVSAFVNSPGFGVTRGIPPTSDYVLRLPAVEPVPLSPGARPSPESGSSPNGFRNPFETELGPTPNDNFHRESVVDFVYADGFGYVRDRAHVAGFQSHRFTRMPTLRDESHWEITLLQLVSLLKFEEPAVYLSDNLPRMDELKTAPTRPLDYFEKKALQQLRDGDELVVDRANDHLRLFGAIRNMNACLKCHHGEQGELLGAFSYELQRER